MSLDRSLKSGAGLGRHRNVLTRPERVAKLLEKGKFDMSGANPLNLPKVGNRKVAAGGKPKKEATAEGAATEGGATTATGGTAKPAPAGSAKQPATSPAKGAPPGKGAPAKK